jgi:hypothetical protein
MSSLRTWSLIAWLGLALAPPAAAQVSPAPDSARATAPFDPTGVWVSVVTEDWRWRMVTPGKGDVLGIPLNAEGLKIAQAWDYAADAAAGNACKAYGAGGIMRMPTRLRISWQDDDTLKIETDAGQQTKLLFFAPSRPPSGGPPGPVDRMGALGPVDRMGPRTLQGHAVAEWVDVFTGGRGGRGGGGRAEGPAYGTGALRVVTTNLRDGYLRKNGVPYSQNATVTEYFDRVPGPDGAQWLVVKTTVADPTYLNQPYLTSSHFMREPDESKWRPGPCEIDPPLMPTRPTVR